MGNLEVKARSEKLKEHNAKLKKTEKAMEDQIKRLDTKSAKTDKLLSAQLKRIAGNKKQMAKMDAQTVRLEQLAREGKVVAQHIRDRTKAGRHKAQKEILTAQKQLQA